MTRIRNRFFVVSDILLLPLAALLAFLIRFEGANWDIASGAALNGFILYGLPVKLAILFGLGMYRRLWQYASISDLGLIARAIPARHRA